MRIVFLAHYAGQYGANQSLLTLVQGLRDRGASPLALLPEDGPIAAQLESVGIEYKTVPYAPWMAPVRRLWRGIPQASLNVRMRPVLSRLLAEAQADLVYSNSSVIGIGAQAAHDAGLPHLWHLREIPKLAFGMVYIGGESQAQTLLAEAAALVAVSNTVRIHVLPEPLQARCAVVYNGVLHAAEMERLYPIGGARKTGSRPIFVMLGSINPNKGQELALRALASLPFGDAELWIAGTGGHRYVARLERLAQTLGIDARVRFCGFLQDPLELYQAADAVLVCTAYEGMGRVTAEAMALGVPVIGLESTGTAELIRPEVTGLLFDGSPEHLAQQMARMLREAGLAERLRVAAFSQARTQFTIEQYCDRVWSICRTAVEQWHG